MANGGSNDVSAYTINAKTGVLTQIDADAGTGGIQNFPAGTAPASVGVDPSGKFAYVANNGANTVTAYTIDSVTGALTFVANTAATGTFLQSVTVDPSGKFAYVAHSGGGSVSAYGIDAVTGALTAVGAAVPAGSDSMSVIVDPSGKFAYVANFSSNDVSVYTINAGTGVLTAAGTMRARPGSGAIAMTASTTPVTYTPKFAYVANQNSNTVSAYTINATTGRLAPLTWWCLPAPVPAPLRSTPRARFAYVANFSCNYVSAYTIDSGTGALTPIDADSGTPGIQNFAAGTGPTSVTVDPSGKFAYVANFSSNSVSAYIIDAGTGALSADRRQSGDVGVQ